MAIGCPECDATVNAAVPAGPGLVADREPTRLRGTEAACRNCGHELELYFYLN
ncbi:hypothetical protein C482_16443 [Natrialba chahannaoensis JCM 10990]|uniref:Uncharacterized protein n=1 Tax=Natrialba chahannaoensis JCM 10990 TaxID=1227492 RepID=M0ABL1_9EURY|nr:hypothetical protein [Natrialba chahannaoensis]ELY95252.1 hypothetical protein C482_16443 [Natrialba chahannaoensis JCM 10990]